MVKFATNFMEASLKKYILNFKVPGGTSRGVLKTKETWFLILKKGDKYGIGECAIFRGLSADDRPDYESRLEWVRDNISLGRNALLKNLQEYPSIQFGVEQAFASLTAEDPFVIYPSAFTSKEAPIPINGLIWMGDPGFMQAQLEEKLERGLFHCIKMKIGALEFQKEYGLLESIRSRYSQEEIEIRVDANGAFSVEEAPERLNRLAELQIHSIEQPIKAGQHKAMASLCEKTPLPIALDEELIGVFGVTKKEELLQMIKPQFIILKPSLIGGYNGSEEWIAIAERMGIDWWVTSTLESNIGLNAIAQWTYSLKNKLPQGLGTGSLFKNNFESPLVVQNGNLYYRNGVDWENELIENLCI